MRDIKWPWLQERIIIIKVYRQGWWCHWMSHIANPSIHTHTTQWIQHIALEGLLHSWVNNTLFLQTYLKECIFINAKKNSHWQYPAAALTSPTTFLRFAENKTTQKIVTKNLKWIKQNRKIYKTKKTKNF